MTYCKINGTAILDWTQSYSSVLKVLSLWLLPPNLFSLRLWFPSQNFVTQNNDHAELSITQYNFFVIDIFGPSMKSGLSKGTGYLDKRFIQRLIGKMVYWWRQARCSSRFMPFNNFTEEENETMTGILWLISRHFSAPVLHGLLVRTLNMPPPITMQTQCTIYTQIYKTVSYFTVFSLYHLQNKKFIHNSIHTYFHILSLYEN
jgi:hypothetical protein